MSRDTVHRCLGHRSFLALRLVVPVGLEDQLAQKLSQEPDIPAPPRLFR
jgi:hypothetical protein